MERKILHISSCRESVTEKFAVLIRELGRRQKKTLWGKAFSPDEEAENMLYLDSGGRGNLYMMASAMGAEIIEYIFKDKSTGECYVLLSEMLKSEYRDGEICYISSKDAASSFGSRIKAVDSLSGSKNFFFLESSGPKKSPVYSAIESEVKKNVDNGCLSKGGLVQLMEMKESPSVIICNAFLSNGAFAYYESCFGSPLAIHLMNRSNHIYAPYTALDKEIFTETEAYVKEALFAVCRWILDSGEESSARMLEDSFNSLSGGEVLIERTIRTFTNSKMKRK